MQFAPEQDTEHELMQCTVHVEPLAQVTLPLSPTVISHSASAWQLTLQDLPHVPVHVLPLLHASEQLSPPQPESVMSHDAFAGHEHDAPLHSGFVPPPQPARMTMLIHKALIFISSLCVTRLWNITDTLV